MNPSIRRALLAASAVAVTVAVTVAVSVQRAAATGTAAQQYTEKEAATVAGQNDTIAKAQRLNGFGTGAWDNGQVTVHGTLSPATTAIATGAEDNGSIALATPTGINGSGAVTTTGIVGDGPHGALGDKKNDFDFYKLTGKAADTVTVSTAGSPAGLDTVVGVYDAAGQLLASDDNGAGGLLSRLSYTLPANGDYFVLVAGQSGAGAFPVDPNNSASGLGGADQGTYNVLIASAPVDKDFYGVYLRKGDVLGGGLDAEGKRVTVFRPNGTEAVGSEQNLSGLYPASSPLPRTTSGVFAYVAENTGWYSVAVTGGFGAYDLNLSAKRPATESDSAAQTVFLDFNGGQIDTTPLGGDGVKALSGLSTFLPSWGLSSADESAVISKVVAVVTENVKTDLVAKGLNPNVTVNLRNSRDNADTFGAPNVSRVVVGGTVAESGLFATTAAQSVDPGNFTTEETAIVQLDRLAEDGAGSSLSLNAYLGANSNRVAFVGQAIGNLVSREIGHLVGNFDTDPDDQTANLMDADGNFQQLFGVGADGVGGTADDVDVDFGKDAYAPAQGFSGVQDTLNVAAWGLSKPCN
ncbi:pre-peptidase C-terminal domain-containing protein [Kribbella sp. NPDC055071]